MERDPATAQRLTLSKLLQKVSETTPQELRWVNAFWSLWPRDVLGGGALWVLIWSVLDRVEACGVLSFGMLWGYGGWDVFIHLNGN